MHKKRRKKLAGLLAVIMLLSSVNVMTVFAEEPVGITDNPIEQEATEETVVEENNGVLENPEELPENDEVSDTVEESAEETDTSEDETPIPENAEELSVITGMDVNGNVYEVSSESGEVEQNARSSRAASGKIVNFNTKGAVVTNYKEVSTGASGYTCGAYGADAAYLGTYNDKVRFMLSGVIGEVAQSDVQIVDIANASSISYYTVSNGRLIHYITTNISKTSYPSSLDNGPAPSYLSEGTRYYSYDGHYFYTYNSFSNMISDYTSGTRAHSVNVNAPFFNYYQYLPLRSQAYYDANSLNSMINNNVSSSSKMQNTGNTMVSHQNTYGVNALIMSGIAANESAWGTSSIAQNKNNLFGLNAVDSSPGESANYYSNVSDCVKDFAETYMSKRYLRSGYTYYKGGFLGNKASGINVSYASDPYWGEKAANIASYLDRKNGAKDYGRYTIGIKDLLSNQHTGLNVRQESAVSSNLLYQTVPQSQYAFLILNDGKTYNGFYKVQSDPVLNSSRSAINTTSGVYKFVNMYAYASQDYITIVHKGTGGTGNPITWDKVSPVKVPSALTKVLTVTPHVEELGWIEAANNGEQAGTTGISYAMQAVKLKINNISGLGIEYSAHVAEEGWLPYVADDAVGGTTGKGLNLEALKIRLTGEQKDEYSLYYRAHVSGTGWQEYVSSDQIAGTTGKSKSIEAIQVVLLKKEKSVSVDNRDLISYSTYIKNIGWGGESSKNGEQSGTVGLGYPLYSVKISSNVSGLGVEYSTHIPNVGWQSYVSDGNESKVSNEPKRIEAIRIRLTGAKASEYDIYYRAHMADYGWLGWAKNDEKAGTQGLSCQMEAIQIVVVKKGQQAPGSTENAFIIAKPSIKYSSYVHGSGWQGFVSDGKTSGTSGKSLAIEGIKISLANNNYQGNVEYSAHIQDYGWESWKQSGTVSGQPDKQKRVEAVKIRLTNELEKTYDIYYRVHAQYFGWLGWAKNGAEAGTEGYSYRIEALEVKLVKKGEAAPGNTTNCFKKKNAVINYSAHVQNIGWQSYKKDGDTAGTSRKSLRVEALKINLSNLKYSGGISYSVHVQDYGWRPTVSNGAIAGITGKSKRVEAVKIQLTGTIAEHCDVYYRVHVQDYGWMAWTKNGNAAGTQGLSKRVEAIQIQIVNKGEAAPSTSGNAFLKK